MTWLLSQDAATKLHTLQSSGMLPTPEQEANYEAKHFAAIDDDSPRLLTVAGNNATISVRGALTNTPSLFAYYLGGANATYPDIITALRAADADPDISEIIMDVESPGGTIAGLFPTLQAMDEVTTPITARVQNLAASAAYALVAKADRIVAMNRGAQFGSVGIVVRGYSDPDQITITSTEAPLKAPDIGTEEGQAAIREELDAVHELFVEAIADGRGTSPRGVNENFGRGAVLLAEDALERGMIDEIQGRAPRTEAPTLSLVGQTKPAKAAIKPETGPMDLETLKASHPALYEQLMALGIEKGVAQERERVEAFIVAGQMSGDWEAATKHISDGAECTPAITMQYALKGANNADQAKHQADGDAAAAAADGVGADTDIDEDAAEKASQTSILALAAEMSGVDLNRKEA